jgi:DNA-binding IclR family transcriptional regulator
MLHRTDLVPEQDRGAPKPGTQAIRRAFTALRIIAAGREEGVPLLAVAQSTGLTRPTVHRILHALIEEGIVERNEKTGYYAVGSQVSELALARQSRSPLLVAAEPHLEQASKRLGDTIFLTTLTGLDTLCVARRIGAFPIQVLSIEVGARRPLGVSSAGIGMLAAMPAPQAQKIIRANASRFAMYRTDVSTAEKQTQTARRNGYCLRAAGLVHGTRALSVAIRGADGHPIAAVTLAAVRARINPRREGEVAEVLRHTATSIERALAAGR